MRKNLALLVLLICSPGPALAQAPADKGKPRYDRRWVYAAYNLLVDKNADDVVALIGRAARAGYNGIVLADYKFNVLDRLPPRYFKNVARVQKAAAAAGVEIIPTVCPIGYSAGLLAHDPNKVYDLVRDQVRRVHELLKPKTFFMGHDEIRVANWCRACAERKLTPGALLADNVRRCVKIIRDISLEAEVVVWSDMFDPHHNAVEKYYLVNGPLTGSWDGLPGGVTVANWNGGKAAQSLKWFAGRGQGQIIAGYYDGDLENFGRWDAAARGVPGVRGFLYTTWRHRFDHLEAYGKALLGKD